MIAAGACLNGLPAEEGEAVGVDLGTQNGGEHAKLAPGERFELILERVPRCLPGTVERVPHPIRAEAEKDVSDLMVGQVICGMVGATAALDSQHLGSGQRGFPQVLWDALGTLHGQPLLLRVLFGGLQQELECGLAMRFPVADAGIDDAAGEALFQSVQGARSAVQDRQGQGVIEVGGTHAQGSLGSSFEMASEKCDNMVLSGIRCRLRVRRCAGVGCRLRRRCSVRMAGWPPWQK